MTDADRLKSPLPAPDRSPAAHEAALEFLGGSGGGLAERMGIVFTEASAQRAVATMPVEGNTQPAGIMNGGASGVLAETLASVAATYHAGPGGAAVGLDLNVTHHKAVREGYVTGVATPLSLGNTIAAYQVDITNDAGQRVATARLTCLIRRPAKASGQRA